MESAALAALDLEALARDAADLVRIPSITGDERAALELVAERAQAVGLDTDLHQYDLTALRALPGHPGEEAARDELWGVTATLPGSTPRRLALNGHIDVVGPGTEPWQRDPWSGAIENGRLHGRGSVDMKAAVIAAQRGERVSRRLRSSSRPSRPRRTEGSAPSPRSSATPPSTPRCSPSRPACASSAPRRAR